MSGTPKAAPKYTLKDANQLEAFVGTVLNQERAGGMKLDSTTAAASAISAMGSEAGEKPRALDELLGLSDVPEEKMVKAIFDGVAIFEREHGFRPTGDLLLAAVDQGRSIFDSATNSHHDQISLTPNAPVVAILGAFAEACPFAGYLPADRGSNEARLIIVSHQAGSNWGDYAQGDLMDGIKQGGSYMGSSRTLSLSAPNDTLAYKFAFTAQAAAGAALNLLRGRAIVYINGQIAAQEISNGSSTLATAPVAGSVLIAGVTYQLSGTVTPAGGLVSITPTPALPAGTVVTTEAFVDYEQDASVTPRMAVNASVYQLFASPYRALYQVTPESRSQFANEVGVDAGAEAMMAVRGQYSMERHYNAIRKAKLIGSFVNTAQFDFQYTVQIQQKTRAQIWQDFQAVTGVVSQRMAELTADHGITHMYTGKVVIAQFRSMPRDLFEPSGIVDRPGVFRVGKLFGAYDVYYTPTGINEAADGTTSEILCVGRSTQTARCPIIMGDAQAPLFEPLGTTEALKSGYGFSSRSFNAQNPHAMSAAGCALITVTNLK